MPESDLAALLKEAAFAIRALEEREHGCNIGLEPREPCDSNLGSIADRLWQEAKRHA